jgi:hypothetical protein
MATLTLTIGPITATVTANNQKAAKAAKNAALYWGYDGNTDDNQAMADFVVLALRRAITDASAQYQETTDIRAAKSAARADESIKFDD